MELIPHNYSSNPPFGGGFGYYRSGYYSRGGDYGVDGTLRVIRYSVRWRECRGCNQSIDVVRHGPVLDANFAGDAHADAFRGRKRH
jgi:hypothetical protein